MFEPVREAFVKIANLSDDYQSIGNRQLAYQKVQRTARKRPIVKTKKTGNSKSSTDHESSENNIGDNLLFENYDKDGNMISRFPKKKKRIGKIV